MQSCPPNVEGAERAKKQRRQVQLVSFIGNLLTESSPGGSRVEQASLHHSAPDHQFYILLRRGPMYSERNGKGDQVGHKGTRYQGSGAMVS